MEQYHSFKLPRKSKQNRGWGGRKTAFFIMSYDSHLPVLSYALDRHGEHVLEVGSGLASTPLIFKKAKRAISFENNREWFDKVEGHLRHDELMGTTKSFIYTDKIFASVRDFMWHESEPYLSLAFIDSDVWTERCKLISLIEGHADIILLHDSFDEHLGRCGWQDVNGNTWPIPHFKYRLNLYPVLPPNPSHPPTLILSNTVDVTKWEVPGLTPG